MSTPVQSFANLTEVKHRANLNSNDNTHNTKLQTFLNSADNYVTNQIKLHATIPIASPDPELTSLSSSLAAAEYVYWQSSDHGSTLENGIKMWQKRIQDHIMANYAKKSSSGLAGGKTFGKTGKIAGTRK